MSYQFELKNIDDRMLSFADYPEAKGFIVIFTCNHCPYAIAYEDRMIALHHEFAAKGYPVIAINSNDPVNYPQDSFENMKVRAADKGFPFPYLFDETQEIARNYDALVTPHAFVIQKQKGDLRLAYKGAIDNNKNYREPVPVTDRYLADFVNALSEDGQKAYEENEPRGCSVKWK